MYDKITSMELNAACRDYFGGKVRTMGDALRVWEFMSESSWYQLLSNRRFVAAYDPDDQGLELQRRLGDYLMGRGIYDPNWQDSDSAIRCHEAFCKAVLAFTRASKCTFKDGDFLIEYEGTTIKLSV